MKRNTLTCILAVVIALAFTFGLGCLVVWVASMIFGFKFRILYVFGFWIAYYILKDIFAKDD